MIFNKKILFGTALFLGILIIVQINSYRTVNSIYLRDSRTNVFHELRILKNKNDELENEILTLSNALKQLKDQNSALSAVEDEINKYKKLSGLFPVFGPGVSVSISGNLNVQSMIDLVNELYNIGAEAVSLNGIRLSNNIIGIDCLPNGQIYLNGSILNSPFVFNAIGEPKVILQVLNQPSGILDRIITQNPKLTVSADIREIIQMN